MVIDDYEQVDAMGTIFFCQYRDICVSLQRQILLFHLTLITMSKGKILVNAIQQDVFNINGDGQMGRGYVLKPERYNTIDAETIIDKCALESHVPKAYISASMIALSECIQTHLLNGHTVELPLLGFFSLTSRSTCVTDVEKVGTDQLSKFNIRFRPCADLKKKVDEVEVELAGIYEIGDILPNGQKVYKRVRHQQRGRKRRVNQVKADE